MSTMVEKDDTWGKAKTNPTIKKIETICAPRVGKSKNTMCSTMYRPRFGKVVDCWTKGENSTEQRHQQKVRAHCVYFYLCICNCVFVYLYFCNSVFVYLYLCFQREKCLLVEQKVRAREQQKVRASANGRRLPWQRAGLRTHRPTLLCLKHTNTNTKIPPYKHTNTQIKKFHPILQTHKYTNTNTQWVLPTLHCPFFSKAGDTEQSAIYTETIVWNFSNLHNSGTQSYNFTRNTVSPILQFHHITDLTLTILSCNNFTM